MTTTAIPKIQPQPRSVARIVTGEIGAGMGPTHRARPVVEPGHWEETGVYWVTDGGYDMMFVRTGQGIIAIDAPRP